MKKQLWLLLFLMFHVTWVARPTPAQEQGLAAAGVVQAPSVIDVTQDARFNSVAYVQNAAEFRLACEQAYQLALLQLRQGLLDVRWTADEVQIVDGGFQAKPPAVILDVDETVLDNSAFNARNILSGKPYAMSTWNAWCNESKAGVIPGSLEFVRAAKRLGVEVFYITNRRDEVKPATLENLQRWGFPVTEHTLMTQNSKDNRDGRKTTRRAAVAKDYRIVLLVGDNLSDMCTEVEVRDTQQRNDVARTKTAVLGSRWILIPNPVYGAWERALPKDATALNIERP
ncbi:5'-nucleotidase, lipoprotein e(P4) family [Planctomycetes bacterium K23_9]|uniref:Lipoprotein E n=1 Tax=Stieleria marina TaxID=1930275 RepID=A0A517NTF0_9BACT|nr:Lipoprotein E precursor [Planctomycetes bacterium K23_9]